MTADRHRRHPYVHTDAKTPASTPEWLRWRPDGRNDDRTMFSLTLMASISVSTAPTTDGIQNSTHSNYDDSFLPHRRLYSHVEAQLAPRCRLRRRDDTQTGAPSPNRHCRRVIGRVGDQTGHVAALTSTSTANRLNTTNVDKHDRLKTFPRW